MKARFLIRISAILIFVHLLGHRMEHFSWNTLKDPKMKEVVIAMKSHSAKFMGATKSMHKFVGKSVGTFFNNKIIE